MAIQMKEVVRLGFSPTMLYPDSFLSETELTRCYYLAEQLPEYEALESFLPDDAGARKKLIRRFRGHGQVLNYNMPGYFQEDGPFNLCSDDPGIRKQALSRVKEHLDYAGEAESELVVITGSADRGEAKRPELIKRYTEAFLEVCRHAEQYGIRVLLEPIERHRFKKLLWGPTAECVSFIREMRSLGAGNAGLNIDMAHLPLMEESLEQAIPDYGEIGFEHVHLGNAVLTEGKPFYGHTHPPLAVKDGLFSHEDLVKQFGALMDCGFIPKEAKGKRASISLEVKPYPGMTEYTSIRAMYEQCEDAFYRALNRSSGRGE